MFQNANRDLQKARSELQASRAELDELEKQLRSFEARVDSQLGSLLDQLTELNMETSILDEQLRHIREQRLFGPELMHYLAGAPLPARPVNLDDLPPEGLSSRKTGPPAAENHPSPTHTPLPDIKTLYRRLARRYHPDLARTDSDRTQATEQMKEINQAYQAGNLQALMKLAGMNVPFWVDVPTAKAPAERLREQPLTELEKTKRELRDVRQNIRRLSSLPLVKLSLDYKLAWHQGRNLLYEMAVELQYKVARKLAERDYLQAQIKASMS
jgi:hypothetical protein